MVCKRRERLVEQRPSHYEGVAKGRTETTLHYAGSEVGNSCTIQGLRVESVLRMVRCPNRILIDNGTLHKGLEAMVGSN